MSQRETLVPPQTDPIPSSLTILTIIDRRLLVLASDSGIVLSKVFAFHNGSVAKMLKAAARVEEVIASEIGDNEMFFTKKFFEYCKE